METMRDTFWIFYVNSLWARLHNLSSLLAVPLLVSLAQAVSTEMLLKSFNLSTISKSPVNLDCQVPEYIQLFFVVMRSLVSLRQGLANLVFSYIAMPPLLFALYLPSFF